MKKSKYQFFCDDLNTLQLNEDESKHALKVLRLGIGDFINVLDGKGKIALCCIHETHKNKMTFKIEEIIEQKVNTNKLSIAIAPTKNIDRFEFFLEKACEIGVNSIYPMKCFNSERKEIKIEKLNKTLISALKQSGQYFLPMLHELTPFSKIVTDIKTEFEQVYIAHCDDDTEKIDFFDLYNGLKKSLILIGPEGDFSKEEINLAKQNGIIAVSLGNSRLRTETAGIRACISAQLKN